MTRSLASVSPIETRAPAPGERPDHDAEVVGGRRELGGPLAGPEPHEVPLRLGYDDPGVRQPLHHPLALGDQAVHALEERGSAASEATAAACATLETPKGRDTARSAPAISPGPIAYPTRKPASP